MNSQNRPKYYSTSSIGDKLHFPSRAEVLDSVIPQRRLRIPVEFSGADMYKNVLSEAVYGKSLHVENYYNVNVREMN